MCSQSGTSVKWCYASQYKQKVYRSAYSGGVARYARHMCRWVVHAIVRYGHWLQVRNYQSSVNISLRASQHTYSLPRIDPYMCKATNGVHSLLASTEFSYGRYPYSVKLTNSVQHPVFASKMEALHCNCMQAVLVRWCGHQRRRLAAKAGARRHRPTQVENL